jgi:hypothetical protein
MAVPVAIVVVSFLICSAVALDQRLHQMCFYYFLSLAALNTLMAVSVLPAAVYVVTAGELVSSFNDIVAVFCCYMLPHVATRCYMLPHVRALSRDRGNL